FSLLAHAPPDRTLFPYTTLFRSAMKKTVLLTLLIFSAFAKAENPPPAMASTVQSMEEMHRLVSPNSATRTYLWCAVVSSKLGMNDVYSLFMQKTKREAKDNLGLIMALPYMMGFVDSEVMNMGEKDVGTVLGSLYSANCMKLLLPPKAE